MTTAEVWIRFMAAGLAAENRSIETAAYNADLALAVYKERIKRVPSPNTTGWRGKFIPLHKPAPDT